MKPYKVIVNPVAGHGNGLRSIPNIVRLLDKHELSYDLVRTERRWHAAEITRKAVDEGYEVIVAVGGDGTVNEVINGLMQAKQDGLSVPALGNLCVGRGNDFAGGVGIPADLEQGCLALAENHRRTIDIGRVFGGIHPQGRYFGNCVGIGFDAIATIEVAKLPRWGGFTSFLMAVFKTVFLYNNAPLATIIYDDRKITQRSLMISIMNGRRLGGKFLMAPDSRPDDGLFNLCIVEQMRTMRIFQMIPHFLRGTQAAQPEIKVGQAERITIQGEDGPLPAQTDGEIICVDGSHLEIELLPLQIDVVVLGPGK